MSNQIKSDIKRRLKLLHRSAKKRKITVDLNVSHYEDLLSLGCTYCGKELLSENGYCLDRMDNSKGYIFYNILPCCKICNRAKGTMEKEDFFIWIERAFKHHKSELEKFKLMTVSSSDFKKMTNKIQNRSAFKNSSTIEMEGIR